MYPSPSEDLMISIYGISCQHNDNRKSTYKLYYMPKAWSMRLVGGQGG